MLKKIRLKNFKLHEDTSIEASRITVFIGPNNSGKSSIFQALLALRQASEWESTNFCYEPARQVARAEPPYHYPPGQVVDTGPFQELARKGRGEITIELEGIARTDLSPQGHFDFALTAELRIKANKLTFHGGKVQSSEQNYEWHFIGDSPHTPTPISLLWGDFEFTFTPTDRFSLVGLSGWKGPSGGAQASEEFLRAKGLAEALGKAPSILLRSVHPVYALRGFEAEGYPIAKAPPPDLDRLSLSDRTIALGSKLIYARELEESLSTMLSTLTGTRLRLEARLLAPGDRVNIRIAWPGEIALKTLMVHEGSGVSQLPFILIPLALTPRGETLLLSEPEAHLHPKWQAQLTGMLVRASEKASIQLFIETHSEHVLHRLLHAVAKGELSHDDLTIYYFENKQGRAEARKLVIDEKGGVEGGLPGFFDQSLDELSEYIQALKEPKA